MKSPRNFSLKKGITLFLSLIFTCVIHSQSWDQVGSKIEGDNGADQMGFHVSFNADGTIFASSSPRNDTNGENSGQVRVYEFQSGNWTQIGQELLGNEASDLFGFSLDISDDGTILAIGAPSSSANPDGKGFVQVFQYTEISNTWTQIGQTIEGDFIEDQMGYSVSLNEDGTTLAVGANRHDNSVERTGQIKVFQLQSNTWNPLGNIIFGENSGDLIGTSLSLNKQGNRLVSGGTSSNTGFTNGGHVKVFELVGTTWNLMGNPFYGLHSSEGLGYSVSFNDEGTIVAMSALGNDDVFDFAGRVSVYQFDGSDWVQIGSHIYGTQEFELTGDSISLNGSGNILAIGGSSNGIVGPFAGFTRVFQNQSGNWVQIGNHILAESFGDSCGSSVSMNDSGNKVVIGSSTGYNGGDDSGHVRVFETNLSTLSTDDVLLSSHDVSLFPNPASDVISLASEITFEEANVYDASGRLILKNQSLENKKVDISELNSGIYVIQFMTKDRKAITKKFLKR